MSFFSFLSSELTYSVQQLIYQPATRRTATYVGAGAGFTIVELLIVIVIIAVLAAIVVVGYNGMTSAARDSALKSDLSSMAKKLEAYKAIHSVYPANDVNSLDAAGLKANKSLYDLRNNLYYMTDTSGRWYAIGAIVKNVVYCLESGKIRENAGSACNSYANTGTNVRNQATAAGVDGATISLWGGVGYDNPDDGSGNGWNAWME
jgi:prepilin-type N-terminal cleavage/methylation domain-containing protein